MAAIDGPQPEPPTLSALHDARAKLERLERLHIGTAATTHPAVPE